MAKFFLEIDLDKSSLQTGSLVSRALKTVAMLVSDAETPDQIPPGDIRDFSTVEKIGYYEVR